MYNNFTDENLNKLGIYALRTLARKVGVNSPTSKKKEVLIEEIKSIQNGSLKPNFNNKFGRPVKQIGTSGDIFSDFVVGGDSELEQLIAPANKDDRFIVFNQEFDSSNIILSSATTQVKGVLRKTEQGTFYMLNSLKLGTKLYVIFDESVIQKYNLIAGDFVCGTACVYESKNYAKIVEVLKINGFYANENKTNLEQELIIPEMPLIGTNLYQGQSKLFMVDGGVGSALDFVNRFAKQFVQESYKCVVLGLQISIETKLKLDKMEGITDIISLTDDTAKFSQDRINDAINHATSLFLHNQKVVLFVLDILQIYHILDTIYQTNPNLHSEESELYVRKILGLCRASQNASISTLCLYSSDQQELYDKEIAEIKKIINY